MISLLLSVVLAQNSIPFQVHREWTLPIGWNSRVLGVYGQRVHYSTNSQIGVVDLKSGKKVWQVKFRDLLDCTSTDKKFFAIDQVSEKKSRLIAIDAATGKVTTLLNDQPNLLAVDHDAKSLYVITGPATLSALDLNTAKPKWKVNLAPHAKPQRSRASLTVGPDCVYAAVDELAEYCVDPISGKVRWQIKAQYAGLYAPIFVPGGVITQLSGLTFRDSRTGKIKWTQSVSMESKGIANGVLIGEADDKFVGIDLKTGKMMWSIEGGEEGFRMGGDRERLAYSDGKNVWLAVAAPEFELQKVPLYYLTGISSQGKIIGRIPLPYSGELAYYDKERMVTISSEAIFGYGKGGLAPWPTDATERKRLAERSVQKWRELDDAEQRHLLELSEYTFVPLVKKMAEWSRLNSQESGDGGGLSYYSVIEDTARYLDQIFKPEHTQAVIDVWSALGDKDMAKSILEQLLERHGDQSVYAPVMVARLRKAKSLQGSEAGLYALSKSSHPDAVKFFIEILNDPNAYPVARQMAFTHLAGTGGEAGIAAVRKWIRQRKQLKPWYERIDLSKLRARSILSTKKDAKGRTWMFFMSGVLGHFGDLFIAEKTQNGWGRPVWIGVFDGDVFEGEAPTSYRGVSIKKIVESEWLKMFVDDEKIRVDSDHDGLTDLAEARLSTDPQKADTDGDGFDDATDPCPNAAPAANMSDEQKIAAACIEARFFEDGWQSPALLSLDGVAPFEVYGYPATVIWGSDRKTSPLGRVYGGGVNLIGFHAASMEARYEEPWVQFGPDHMTAKTIIRRYSGGLNGDGTEVSLKKFGDDWYVVDMIERYVS